MEERTVFLFHTPDKLSTCNTTNWTLKQNVKEVVQTIHRFAVTTSPTPFMNIRDENIPR
jgi:hypothetical protein